MIIDPAFAQMGSPAGDPLGGILIPMLIMILIFYFLLIRPQQTRAKEHRDMVTKIRRGDTVVTSGGFIGRVSRVTENSDEVEIELADNLKVRVVRSTLIDVRTKGEPVKDAN